MLPLSFQSPYEHVGAYRAHRLLANTISTCIEALPPLDPDFKMFSTKLGNSTLNFLINHCLAGFWPHADRLL